MFSAIAYYSSAQGNWHIIIGRYDTEKQAYKAIQVHAAKNETDPYLQYYQIKENNKGGNSI